MTNPIFISVLDPTELGSALDRATDGPLHEVPFAVDDTIDVATLPTTAGCPALQAPAVRSADAVERLVDAGAVAIGKTNVDQFGIGFTGTRSPYGPCHSVASPDHVSGGSSAGSAVAVATGIVPFALATDALGSARIPAALNGILGMRPTRGLISNRGALPTIPSLDSLAVLAGDAVTLATVFDILTFPDPEDPDLRRVPRVLPSAAVGRIGIPATAPELEPQHRHAWQDAVSRVAESFPTVPIDVAPLLGAGRDAGGAEIAAERRASLAHLLVPDGPHLDAAVRRTVLSGTRPDSTSLFAERRALQRLRELAAAAFRQVDALLLPATPGHPTLTDIAADPLGADAALATFTALAGPLDLCAITLPLARRRDGLPFGAQLLAPAFADHRLLELARVLVPGTAEARATA